MLETLSHSVRTLAGIVIAHRQPTNRARQTLVCTASLMSIHGVIIQNLWATIIMINTSNHELRKETIENGRRPLLLERTAEWAGVLAVRSQSLGPTLDALRTKRVLTSDASDGIPKDIVAYGTEQLRAGFLPDDASRIKGVELSSEFQRWSPARGILSFERKRGAWIDDSLPLPGPICLSGRWILTLIVADGRSTKMQLSLRLSLFCGFNRSCFH